MISPTYLLSFHHPHAFPTFLCYPNTVSGLDPLFHLFLLFHMLFSCHLHFVHQCLFILQESIWMSPSREVFLDSTSVTHHPCPPLPHPRPVPGALAHDPTNIKEYLLDQLCPWLDCEVFARQDWIFLWSSSTLPIFIVSSELQALRNVSSIPTPKNNPNICKARTRMFKEALFWWVPK